MRVQRVTTPEPGGASYELRDDDDRPVTLVNDFLDYLGARGCSPNTVAAYAYDLRHFSQFLAARGLGYHAFRPPDALELLTYLRRLPSRRPACRLAPVLTTTAGSRDLSITSLTNLITVEAVEWPAGQFPPRYVGHSLWQTTLTLDVQNAPSGVENVNVYWTKVHVLDGSTSTLPVAHEDVVAIGAAAYAALDWTSFATNRINTGGDDVWGRYKALADERLRYFRQELMRIGRRNTVRHRRMYTTDAPSVFEQSRVKY